MEISEPVPLPEYLAGELVWSLSLLGAVLPRLFTLPGGRLLLQFAKQQENSRRHMLDETRHVGFQRIAAVRSGCSESQLSALLDDARHL